MCFVMNKIAISILDTQDILTVLNTFSFQRPFPQLRKAQCFPPSQAVKKEHICILVDQAPLPHVFTPLSPNLAFPPAIRAGYVERKYQNAAPYDWRLVNVFGHVATAYYEDLKTRDEPAFRANNNKKVVLCGHSTDDIITYRFLTSSVVGASTISTLTQDCACLHWMIPNKNTFDDDCVVVRLKSDNVCKILMKNMTWTDNPAGKACVKTAVQRTRNNTDQPLVLPKVMTHVMYSIGINATAGVILNATRQRWTSDTHSDYYMDGDGTVPTVSLSSILQDAVPIARILDIIAQATAEEMEYDDSLNPPDFFSQSSMLLLNTGPTWCLDYCGETYLDSIQSHRILILRHEGRSILILRVILHLLMDNTSNQSESQNFYGTEDKIEDARIHPSHITTSHSITPECLSETKSCSWPSGPGQTSSLSTIDAATVEFEHQDSPNVAANQ
ncbi:hypothetical protein BLNAU_8858 [Blattamonas nauphoetae]|uniref:Uncharacterized protein n=1 Tax=Blattamonas nauphoetae TaxID=2049346 RepID=A0ABQ9XXU5_9EUKA|nr:hypothetical protein BLNAU_8858 [Blattamonas nauphoetae]